MTATSFKTYCAKFFISDGTFRYELRRGEDIIDVAWDSDLTGHIRLCAPNRKRAEILPNRVIDKVEIKEYDEMDGWTIDPWTGDPVKIADSASE